MKLISKSKHDVCRSSIFLLQSKLTLPTASVYGRTSSLSSAFGVVSFVPVDATKCPGTKSTDFFSSRDAHCVFSISKKVHVNDVMSQHEHSPEFL